MKLKRSVLGLLLFFSLVPLCIFGIFSIYETNQKIDAMLKENLAAISENQMANIQKFATERKNSMERIASYELTVDAIKQSLGETNKKIDREYLDNILKEQKRYGTYVASASVMDREFRVVASSEEYELYEISQFKSVNEQYHSGDFVIGDVYERRTDDGLKKVVPAYIGVYEKGVLIGYISEELDIAYFNDLRLNMDMLSEGTFYLLDGNYTIITAGNNSDQSSLNKFVTKSEQRSEYQEKWEKIDFEKYPSGELTYHYDNEEYVTYYSNVENTEWGIRITENLTAQKRDMKSYSLLFVMILFILAVGIVAVQIFMAHKIVNPIQEAINIFHTIEESQDYSLRMPKHSPNEMGELMAGINELLEYVEEEKILEKKMQRELRTQAESDSLTGVKNKKAIEKYVMDMINVSMETESPITMGFLDIDDFRNFNTVYGHQQADEVIQYVAKTLQENVKGEVGRIGGDEFLFCYVGTISEENIEENARKTLKILEDGFDNEETNVHISITCSLGIVTAQGENLDYMHMVRMADQAMYQAKNNGKNTVVIKKYSEDKQ